MDNWELIVAIAAVIVAILAWQLPKIPTIYGKTPKTHVKTDSTKKDDIITFGGYDWQVLDVQDNKALLITKNIIGKRPYNDYDKVITWENCTLREYLNNEFYNSFKEEGRAKIIEMPVINDDNLWYGTPGGGNTKDKIFLLSLEEVDKYFGDSGDYLNKRCKGYDNGKFIEDSEGWLLSNSHDESRVAKCGNESSWWWLRSPGGDSYNAARVVSDGNVDVRVFGVFLDYGGVRPALWLNLE